jgi:hypothetical protein
MRFPGIRTKPTDRWLQVTTGKERRITRWEHEHVLEAVQKRLDKNPAGHAPGSRDGRTSLRHAEDADGGDALSDEAPAKVATEMALHVLAYNLARVMNIMGIQPLMAARAVLASALGHLGRSEDARQIWSELKEINPRYSYVDHIGRLPFRDSADADKFTDGLRMAGLAE